MFVLIVWFSFSISQCFLSNFVSASGGTIYLQFLEYSNPGSLLASGSACDHFGSIECDPTFEYIRLTSNTGSPLMSSKSPYHFENKRELNTENSGQLGQKWTIILNERLPSYLSLDVLINERDKGYLGDSFHLIAKFQGRYEVNSDSYEEVKYEEISLKRVDPNPQNKIVLRFKIGLICEKYFYGKLCDKYCKDDGYRAKCGPNGEIICKEGWTGKSCELKDWCSLRPCPRYSTCLIEDNSRKCFCNSTTTRLCLNGAKCEPSALQKNNYYLCQCDLDYYGKHCENYCESNKSNYRCNPQGGKICEPGWMEPECEIFNYCWNETCPHPSVCVNNPQNNGRQCLCNSTDPVKCPCRNHTCMNEGSCIYDVMGQPTCSCVNGFQPPNCQFKSEASRTDKQESHLLKMIKNNLYVIVAMIVMASIITISIITVSVFCCRYKTKNINSGLPQVVYVRRNDNTGTQMNDIYCAEEPTNQYLSVGNLLDVKSSEYELSQNVEEDVYEQCEDELDEIGNNQIRANDAQTPLLSNEETSSSDTPADRLSRVEDRPPVPTRSLSVCDAERKSPRVMLRKQMTLK